MVGPLHTYFRFPNFTFNIFLTLIVRCGWTMYLVEEQYRLQKKDIISLQDHLKQDTGKLSGNNSGVVTNTNKNTDTNTLHSGAGKAKSTSHSVDQLNFELTIRPKKHKIILIQRLLRWCFCKAIFCVYN